MSDWVRALGIDYGTARIGIAVSDDLGFLAHPLETVPGGDSEKAAARLVQLVPLRLALKHILTRRPIHKGNTSMVAEA